MVEGKQPPFCVMAFRDDGVSALCILRNFEGYDSKVRSWTEACSIIPAIGAQRALMHMDTYWRPQHPGETEEEWMEAARLHQAGRPLSEDPRVQECVAVISYDGPSEAMEAVFLPYKMRRSDKGYHVTWGQSCLLEGPAEQAEGWMAPLLATSVKLSLRNEMPPMLQAIWPALLEQQGHHVIISGERFGQN